MSDTDARTDTAPVATDSPAATDTEAAEPAPPPFDPTDELAKWKEMARKHEQRAAANADKAKRFDEIEEANKTETQRLQDQLEALQKERDEARLQALRTKVASEAGVPANLLTGDNEEQLIAAADALRAFKGDTPKAAPAAVQGDQGASVAGSNGTSDDQLTEDDVKRLYAEKKYAEIEKAREAGRLSTLLGA